MENRFIENIIQDLYTLEPSLKERDEEVRLIVSTLMRVKPVVDIDSTFVNLLRARLVKPASVVSPIQSHSLSWWTYRLFPMGAIAILTIMLIPSMMTPRVDYREESLYVDMDDAYTTRMAPSEKHAPTFAPESTSLMQVSNDSLPTDSFTVNEQEAGNQVIVDFATLTQASFVVITKNMSGEISKEIIGVSPLLEVGHTEQIDVPLTIQTHANETYYAVLYRDDGDGIWERDIDTPAYDASGVTPMYVLFSIKAENLDF